MGEWSNIGWCDHTANFWIGCTQVSEACRRCYAMTWDARPTSPDTYLFTEQGWGFGKPRYLTKTATWKKPFSWERRAQRQRRSELVFANSLSDLGDNEVDPLWRLSAFTVMALTPTVTWQALSKRPDVLSELLQDPTLAEQMIECALPWLDQYGVFGKRTKFDDLANQIKSALPFRNVWFGSTVENEARAEERIGFLEEARCRGVVPTTFLSVEPLLENPRLDRKSRLQNVDWVIVGGEHADDFTPIDENDLRHIRDTVKSHQKALYFKQGAGQNRSQIEARGCEIDGETFKEYPITATTDRNGPIHLAA